MADSSGAINSESLISYSGLYRSRLHSIHSAAPSSATSAICLLPEPHPLSVDDTIMVVDA